MRENPATCATSRRDSTVRQISRAFASSHPGNFGRELDRRAGLKTHTDGGSAFMARKTLKARIRKLLGLVGLETGRKASSSRSHDQGPRNSVSGVLQQVKRQGFSPATVIDVGAAFGSFATQCHDVFPHSRYVLVEPLVEYRPHLDAVIRTQIPNAEFISAAADAESGAVTIHVHPDLVGSSLRLENEDSDVIGVPRTVSRITLDQLVRNAKLEPPFLLKIDTQGSELNVLSGFEDNLQNAEFVLLEVSLFKFFVGGGELHDVIAFMKARGFVAYDICEFQYRPLDCALSQIDIGFVKEGGQFRHHHFYATLEQRREQFRGLHGSNKGEATRVP
jgi:FkbM family methyltransferase